MTLKVIILAFILKVCSGDADSQSHHKPDHAISSQSFVRHDVPLSYKYSAVHVYTTAKPEQYQPATSSPHSASQQREVQYAPIIHEKEIRQGFNAAHDTGAVQNQPTVGNVKDNLEPKLQSHQNSLSYIPGYNIEVLQAVNRYPGHNEVYKSYPNRPDAEKLHKVNYLNQFVLYPKPHNSNIHYYKVTTQAPQHATLFDFVPKQYLPSSESYNLNQLTNYEVPATQDPYSVPALNLEQLYPPHPKTHRLLINTARAYNFAKLQKKGNQKENKPIGVASHTQALYNIPLQTATLRNTQLYPGNYNTRPDFH